MRKPLMTFFPKGDSPKLVAFVSQEDRLSLKADAQMNGVAHFKGADSQSFSASVIEVATFPNGKGQFQVVLEAKVPETLTATVGMKAQIKLVTYTKKEALVAPLTAITKEGEKTFVQSKPLMTR